MSLGYDSGGRLSIVTLPTGSYQYGYTATSGQLATLSAPDGESLAYSWDGFLSTGTTWSGAVTGSVTRTFDDNFRVTALNVDGSSTAYGYDNDGLLTGAGDETITRDPGDGLIAASTLGGVITAMTYDGFGEPLTDTVTDGATNLYSVGYTRDNLGRITQKIETVNGTTTTWLYGYDGDGRLNAVTKNGLPVASYGYDQNGNRVSVNAAIIASYDNQDRLLTFGSNSYSYNANGELLTKTNSIGTTSYTWDALGNLLAVKLPSGEDIQYLYDGQNRLVGKEVNGKLIEGFLYDGQLEPVAMLDGSGNVVELFVYGTRPNVPDYIIKGGAEYRVISDQVGSSILIVNASTGAIAEQVSYDARGNVTSDSNPGFQPFGFAGGLYDADTGLVHFGARNYDPETGRWISRDPVLFAGGNSNLYEYAISDPINMLDEFGLQGFAFLPYGYSQQDVNTAVAMQQARVSRLQTEAQRGAKFEQAYKCDFKSNQVFPLLQQFDSARSLGALSLATTREAGLWEAETYGVLQAQQGAAWGSGLASTAAAASYLFGAGEAAAFGLDAGDAILSSYQAANESGFTPSMAGDLVHSGP